MRNYTTERDLVLQRWYGANPQPKYYRIDRHWPSPIREQQDVLTVKPPVNNPFRIYGHCLVWKYTLNGHGYGVLTVDGKQQLAHRTAYAQAFGDIPEESQINHLCDRPYCIQPSHLYPGTHQDNKDDQAIFRGAVSHIQLAWLDLSRNYDDPLLQRIANSQRLKETPVVWEPVIQPPQIPFEQFQCTEHDFSIPMEGGESKICRICEESESMPRFYEAYNIGLLARDMCPTAHYHLWDKVLQSGMGDKSHETWRNQAYRRYHDGHDLQVCTCRFCRQDRAKFRELLANHLSNAEQALLGELDRILPQLTEIIDRGTSAAITLWSLQSGLTPEQTGQLADFHPTCLNSRRHLTSSRARLETIISAHLLDTLRFLEVGEGFPSFNSEPGPWKISSQIRNQMPLYLDWTEPISHLADLAIPELRALARAALTKIIPAIQPELDLEQWLNSIYPVLPFTSEFDLQLQFHFRESLMYAYSGRNTSEQVWPHPCEGCALHLKNTGKLPLHYQQPKDGEGFTEDHLY